MTIDYENLHETTVTGTVFKDRAFRYEHTYNLHETYEEKERYAEYKFMYDIGSEDKTHFQVFTRIKEALKEVPLYCVMLFLEDSDYDQEISVDLEQWFFIDSVMDLNAFYKEMNPMIEIAKYRQAEYEKEE